MARNVGRAYESWNYRGSDSGERRVHQIVYPRPTKSQWSEQWDRSIGYQDESSPTTSGRSTRRSQANKPPAHGWHDGVEARSSASPTCSSSEHRWGTFGAFASKTGDPPSYSVTSTSKIQSAPADRGCWKIRSRECASSAEQSSVKRPTTRTAASAKTAENTRRTR